MRKVPGVTQPLHQIVHSTKFLPDDVRRVEVDDEEEGEDEEEEEEEWGGIQEDDEDDEAVDVEVGDAEPPLEWDELFAQVVGEEEGADADDAASDGEAEGDDDDEEESLEIDDESLDGREEDEEDSSEEDVEIVLDAEEEEERPRPASQAHGKRPAGKKRSESPLSPAHVVRGD